MNRHRQPTDPIAHELRARLRAADPLGVDAADEERALARLAARIATESAEPVLPQRRSAFGAPLLTFATLATVTAVAWLGVRFVERSRPAGPSSRPSVAATEPRPSETSGADSELGTASRASGGDSEPESRQIQFETAGGTRVIWVLDPRFTL